MFGSGSEGGDDDTTVRSSKGPRLKVTARPSSGSGPAKQAGADDPQGKKLCSPFPYFLIEHINICVSD